MTAIPQNLGLIHVPLTTGEMDDYGNREGGVFLKKKKKKRTDAHSSEKRILRIF